MTGLRSACLVRTAVLAVLAQGPVLVAQAPSPAPTSPGCDIAGATTENNLGLAYEGLEQDQAAPAAYRRAIELADQEAQPSEQPLINLAILLMHQADASEALPLLLRVVRIAPHDVRAHEQLGKLYMQRHRLPEAQAEIEQAVSLAPLDSRLHYSRGRT